MNGVRMDLWLWAARFFKTRTLAKRACDLGRVLSNGQEAKPGRDVHIGDMLRVTNEGGEFEIEVLGLSEVRGPRSLAHTLYRETAQSEESRKKVAAERKAAREFEIQEREIPHPRAERSGSKRRRAESVTAT